VYFDIDGSGLLNGVEPTLQLAQVALRGLDDLGQTVSVTQISNPSGQFAFGGLRPGVYTLTEVTPPGYTDGIDQFGSAGGTLVPSDHRRHRPRPGRVCQRLPVWRAAQWHQRLCLRRRQCEWRPKWRKWHSPGHPDPDRHDDPV
jgi:hypothetical protein